MIIHPILTQTITNVVQYQNNYVQKLQNISNILFPMVIANIFFFQFVICLVIDLMINIR